MIVEATYDASRGATFSNLFAEALLLYYVIYSAGAARRSDRRRKAR